ncbi:MAG: hypothetical protein M1816_000125 [Peltula sp. TS41687]|nr:MAG: hypothetical protein M1816_000125 [Peltula sp. TS41687]
MSTDHSSDAEMLSHLRSQSVPSNLNLISYPDIKPNTFRRRRRRLSPRLSFAGELERLPLELLHEIFSSLDFQSLSDLRATNFRLRELIDAFLPWRYVRQHALDTLRALTDTHQISQIDSGQLYAMLRSDRCVLCAKYGPYLFLPMCHRICFNCHYHDPQAQLITVSAAVLRFGLKKSQIGLLPKLLSLPTTLRRKRQWLVSVARGRELGIRLHGSQKAMETYMQREYSKRQQKWIKRRSEWSDGKRNGKQVGRNPRQPTPLERLPPTSQDPYRFAASILFPSLPHGGSVVQQGLYCAGCEHQSFEEDGSSLEAWLELVDKKRTSYSAEEFLSHVKKCPGARRLWWERCEKNSTKNQDAL